MYYFPLLGGSKGPSIIIQIVASVPLPPPCSKSTALLNCPNINKISMQVAKKKKFFFFFLSRIEACYGKKLMVFDSTCPVYHVLPRNPLIF